MRVVTVRTFQRIHLHAAALKRLVFGILQTMTACAHVALLRHIGERFFVRMHVVARRTGHATGVVKTADPADAQPIAGAFGMTTQTRVELAFRRPADIAEIIERWKPYSASGA